MEQTATNDLSIEFARQVRSALTHMYDYAYLQNHPLVSSLGLDSTSDELTRAQALRRVLLDCIEQIQPNPDGSGASEITRAYAVLTYRYVDGMALDEIGVELGLSERSLYRELKKGLDAVTTLLWDKAQKAASHEDTGQTTAPGRAGHHVPGRLEAIREELDCLQPSARWEPLDLHAVLRNVVSMVSRLSEQTNVHVTLPATETRPALVADRVLLRQTLVTVFSHALRVARSDLTVSFSQESHWTMIEISEQVNAAIAEGPRQFLPREKPLTVAQELIEAQGGRLELLDTAGQWRMRIWLPAPAEATILVIEDNAGVIALFRRYLGGYRATLIAASDSKQAIALAAKLHPQVIVLDVMMPREDGWEILQRLKKAHITRRIPVIVCSVLNEPELALSMGASGYITKPVTQTDFIQAMQNHLGPLLQVSQSEGA